MANNQTFKTFPSETVNIINTSAGQIDTTLSSCNNTFSLVPVNKNIVQTFLQLQQNDPASFNSNISVEDEMYLFLLEYFKGDHDRAYIEYLVTGKQITDVVKQIVNWKFGGFSNVSSFLDFASGAGRFTRFLTQEISSQHVWSADIYTHAIQFQQNQFKVNGIVSVPNPDDFPTSSTYECILVASLFSHLPERTFLGWLKKLYSLLSNSGVLLFSVHDADVLPSHLEMPDDGMLFIPDSESRSLDTAEYGTTYVTEAYVKNMMKEVAGRDVNYCRAPKSLYWYQDLYVLAKDPEVNFLNFDICPGPLGALDECILDDQGLHLSGWATDFCAGINIKDIQIFINGQLVSSCLPSFDRPDVSEAYKEPKGLRSGWRCSINAGNLKPDDMISVKIINTRDIDRILRAASLSSLSQ